MSSQEHKQEIWNLIKDIKVGMLTTYDSSELRARPMHLVQDHYDGTIWFYTNKQDEKVTEVNHRNAICLTFCNPDDDIYVSLTGEATLSQDRGLIEKFWNPFIAAWFPKGKEDPDVALLEIDIAKGEHWESKNNKLVQLYEIAKANITNEKPDLGENEKF